MGNENKKMNARKTKMNSPFLLVLLVSVVAEGLVLVLAGLEQYQGQVDKEAAVGHQNAQYKPVQIQPQSWPNNNNSLKTQKLQIFDRLLN